MFTEQGGASKRVLPEGGIDVDVPKRRKRWEAADGAGVTAQTNQHASGALSTWGSMGAALAAQQALDRMKK